MFYIYNTFWKRWLLVRKIDIPIFQAREINPKIKSNEQPIAESHKSAKRRLFWEDAGGMIPAASENNE